MVLCEEGDVDQSEREVKMARSSHAVPMCVRYSLGMLLQGGAVHQVGKLLGHPLLQLLEVFGDLGEIGLLGIASCRG